MSLVAVAWPQSESDLSVMLCTLEAHGIKPFVQGAGFGSLFPGPQIPFYNARRIMVPSEDAGKARQALSIFTRPVPPGTYRWPSLLHVLRMVVELLLFNWCVLPASRRRTEVPDKSLSQRSWRVTP